MTSLPIDPATLPAAGFDPFSIEDVPTGELRVKNPTTNQATGWVITLAGPEDERRRARTFARQRRLRHELARSGKMPVSDPQDDEADQLDELVACTLGWTGCAVPYSPEAARKLYADPARRWLRNQVAEALSATELFTRSSAPA